MRTNDPLATTELTFLLGAAYQAVLREFHERLDTVGEGPSAGLRPVHGFVFQILGSAGATGTELAERLGVTKQAAGQIVDDLEQRGYVRRGPHPAGGRRRLVVLTDMARAHLAIAGNVLHALEAEITDQVSLTGLRADLAAVIRALTGDVLPPLRPIW
jgi:DNA-binding MarR family transcriptional regulator